MRLMVRRVVGACRLVFLLAFFRDRQAAPLRGLFLLRRRNGGQRRVWRMLLGSVALVASLPASAASAAPAASLPSGTMAVAQTGTLTFAPAADAYAQESTPGANYGGSANLRV